MRRGQRGEVSLMSVLVAATLMIVVLGASLNVFEGFIAKAEDANLRVESEDAARAATDRVARNLRNIASPTTTEPRAVDRLSSTDIIFKTVNSNGPSTAGNQTNTQRVRYCLDGNRKLRQETQRWAGSGIPAVPPSTGCPGSGWDDSRTIATGIVNTSVPVFTFDSADPVSVSIVHVDLQVDTDLVRLPGPTRLSTGVYLRNQNRRPSADFSVTRQGAAFVLNGSASTDLDSDPLQYSWVVDDVPVGFGITYTHTPAPAWAPGSVHQVILRVSDPGDLSSETTKAVTA